MTKIKFELFLQLSIFYNTLNFFLSQIMILNFYIISYCNYFHLVQLKRQMKAHLELIFFNCKFNQSNPFILNF